MARYDGDLPWTVPTPTEGGFLPRADCFRRARNQRSLTKIVSPGCALEPCWRPAHWIAQRSPGTKAERGFPSRNVQRPIVAMLGMTLPHSGQTKATIALLLSSAQ